MKTKCGRWTASEGRRGGHGTEDMAVSRQQLRGSVALLLLLTLWVWWKYLRMAFP
jgi:hypothetical protein